MPYSKRPSRKSRTYDIKSYSSTLQKVIRNNSIDTVEGYEKLYTSFSQLRLVSQNPLRSSPPGTPLTATVVAQTAEEVDVWLQV